MDKEVREKQVYTLLLSYIFLTRDNVSEYNEKFKKIMLIKNVTMSINT